MCPSLQVINPLEGSLCHCFDPDVGEPFRHRLWRNVTLTVTRFKRVSASSCQLNTLLGTINHLWNPYFFLLALHCWQQSSQHSCLPYIYIYDRFTDFCLVCLQMDKGKRWVLDIVYRNWYSIQEDYEIFDLVSEVEASEGWCRIFRLIVRYFSRFLDVVAQEKGRHSTHG